MAKEADKMPNQTATRLKGYLRESPFFCKIIELLLLVISLGLIIDPLNHDTATLKQMMKNMNHNGLIYASLCSFIMLNSVVILCYLFGEKMVKNMAMVFSTLGAILSLATGIVIISDWDKSPENLITPDRESLLKQMLASGIFSIILSAIFVVDTYVTNKYESS